MDFDLDPVQIIGILFIIGGVAAIATGHVPGALILFGIAALALGFSGQGEVSGAGIAVSGSAGLVLIGLGAIMYYLFGGL